MANTLFNVQQLVVASTPRLYDGDFIDLTSESNAKANTNDVNLDDGSVQKNQSTTKNISTAIQNQASFLTPTSSVADTRNMQLNLTSHKFLVPLNSESPFSSNYLLVDRKTINKVTLPKQNGDVPANKAINILDQVTLQPTSGPSKINFKNIGGHITVEQTPLIQDANIVLPPTEIKSSNEVKVKPSSALQSVLKKVESKINNLDKKSAPTKAMDNIILCNVGKNGGNINPVAFKLKKKTIRPLKSYAPSKNKKKPESFNFEQAVLVPSSSETKFQQKTEKTISPLRGTPQIIPTTYQHSDNVISTSCEDDDVIMLPDAYTEINLSSTSLPSTSTKQISHNTPDVFEKQSESIDKKNASNSIISQTNRDAPHGYVIVTAPVKKQVKCRTKQILSTSSLASLITQGKVILKASNEESQSTESPLFVNKNDLNKRTPNILKKTQFAGVKILSIDERNKQQPVSPITQKTKSISTTLPITNIDPHDNEEESIYFVIQDETGTIPSSCESTDDTEEIQMIRYLPFVSETKTETDSSQMNDLIIESPCTVTPVDITKILNKAKEEKKQINWRCSAEVNTLEHKKCYRRGFTKREITRFSCWKALRAIISSEEKKIKKLKSRIRSQANFVYCGDAPSNLLPEVVKCELDENEEIIMLDDDDPEEKLKKSIYNSDTLPALVDVISQVNDNVRQFKKKQRPSSKKNAAELQSKLAKPEAALKLIQKGLELIRSWSKENSSSSPEKIKKAAPKEKANKSLPAVKNRKVKSDEPKKRGRSVGTVSVDAEPSPKRKRVPNKKFGEEIVTDSVKKVTSKKNESGSTAQKKVKNVKSSAVQNPKKVVAEVASRQETTQKKRGRKKKIETPDYMDDSDDLLIIKKVDILNDNRKTP